MWTPEHILHVLVNTKHSRNFIGLRYPAPVPRLTKLPKREQDICRRVRAAREHLGLIQESFAAQIGVSRASLANLELRRNPLSVQVGLRVCRQFVISERWLATGAGDMRQHLDFPVILRHEMIPFAMPFSEAYDKYMAAAAEEFTAKNPGKWFRMTYDKSENLSFLLNVLSYEFTKFYGEVPQLARSALLMRMEDAAANLITEIDDGKRQFVASGEMQAVVYSDNVSKPIVDNWVGPGINADVSATKSRWEQLVERLKRIVAKERGVQARIAERFAVSRQAVNRWLSGDAAPNADLALQLYHWVEEVEKGKIKP